MKRVKIIIWVFFVSYIVGSCWEKVDFENLEIINKSKTTIYVSISKDDEIFDYPKFKLLQRIKDGENISEIDLTDLYLSDTVSQNTIIKVPRPMVWSDYIDSAEDKKIRLFIIEKDSVDKYGWEYLHANNVYNKKYLLTLKTLEEMKWKLSYNGNVSN